MQENEWLRNTHSPVAEGKSSLTLKTKSNAGGSAGGRALNPSLAIYKHDHRMRRGFLSGDLIDAINFLLAWAASNLVKRMIKMSMIVLLIAIQVIKAISVAPLLLKHFTDYRWKEYLG